MKKNHWYKIQKGVFLISDLILKMIHRFGTPTQKYAPFRRLNFASEQHSVHFLN